MTGSDLPRNARIRAVREATGLTQQAFLYQLNAASARVLGDGVREYSQSTLSKLESGAQEAAFEDITVFAAVDPKRRGKLWLAWGEEVDSFKAPRTSRELNTELAAATGVNDTPARKSATQQLAEDAAAAQKPAAKAAGGKRSTRSKPA